MVLRTTNGPPYHFVLDPRCAPSAALINLPEPQHARPLRSSVPLRTTPSMRAIRRARRQHARLFNSPGSALKFVDTRFRRIATYGGGFIAGQDQETRPRRARPRIHWISPTRPVIVTRRRRRQRRREQRERARSTRAGSQCTEVQGPKTTQRQKHKHVSVVVVGSAVLPKRSRRFVVVRWVSARTRFGCFRRAAGKFLVVSARGAGGLSGGLFT